MNLKRKAVSGVAWSSVANIGERAGVFLIMLLLLRLVSVQEFGTATTAIMIVTVLYPVARFGSFEYLIQHPDPDDAHQSAGFVATLAFSILASLGLFAASWPLALLFDDPALQPAVAMLSPIFVLRGLGTVHEAMLTKAFGFRALAIRRLSGVAAGGLVAIVMASYGYGVMALIAQQLVNHGVSTLLMTISHRWRADLSRLGELVPQVWKMGARYTVSQLFSSMNLSGFGLVIGLFLGTAEAGLFRLAFSAVDLCVQLTVMPFARVSVPIFAQFRSEVGRLGEAYLKALQATSLMTFIVFALMGVLGREIGTLIYGTRFAEAGPLVSVLCLSVFANTSNRLIASLLGAIGQPGELIRISAVQAVASLLFAWLAAPYGLIVVAAAHVARSAITTPLAYHFLRKHAGVAPSDVARVFVIPVAAAIVGVLPVVAFSLLPLFEQLPVFVRVGIGASLGGVTYLVFVVLAQPALLRGTLTAVSPALARRVMQMPVLGAMLRRGAEA
ncbi:oligosaccharide flippase family protein [Croceicoccus sp. Ery15]|uniref:oligosaccharide flippase family protein n=1 Tax=Croceicoccus sp. Ery15 TaxID=1703338 RepID=UPI001E42159A|nr:oligosaccharide flippase family protein [Croceicoccus sp. Ery15]